MSINQNNAKIVSTCNQRITALTGIVSAKATMKINGKLMKLADVIAAYQACIDTRSELVSIRAMFDKALEAREVAEVTRLAIDKGLKAWVVNEFGPSSQQGTQLGFVPPKVGTKSAAKKALAVEKLLATRKARHTMGKRQKSDIKGTVTVPTAPAAPAVTAPAAPAASAPASTIVAPSASPSNGVAVN